MIKKYDKFLERDEWDDSWDDNATGYDYGNYDSSFVDPDPDSPPYNSSVSGFSDAPKTSNYKREKTSAELEIDEEMEHLLYILRTKLKNKGMKNFDIGNRGYDVTIALRLTPKEPLKDIVNIFKILNSIQIELLSGYGSQFDMYETMRGDTVFEFLFYRDDEQDDEDYDDDYGDDDEKLSKNIHF